MTKGCMFLGWKEVSRFLLREAGQASNKNSGLFFCSYVLCNVVLVGRKQVLVEMVFKVSVNGLRKTKTKADK